GALGGTRLQRAVSPRRTPRPRGDRRLRALQARHRAHAGAAPRAHPRHRQRGGRDLPADPRSPLADRRPRALWPGREIHPVLRRLRCAQERAAHRPRLRPHPRGPRRAVPARPGRAAPLRRPPPVSRPPRARARARAGIRRAVHRPDPRAGQGAALQCGRRVRLPLALRGLWHAGAGGDGLRRGGRHLRQLGAAGGRGRHRRARGPEQHGGDRPGYPGSAARPGPTPGVGRGRPRARRALLVGRGRQADDESVRTGRGVKVLMLSKACLVGAYQRKLEELARLDGVELTCLVPPYWLQDGTPIRLERAHTRGYRLAVAPIRFNGHFHIFHFTGLHRWLAASRPDVVHVDEEPYNLATALVLRLAQRRGARGLFFTWQNLLRRYPPPFSLWERYCFCAAEHALAGNREAVDVLRQKGYRG